MLSERDGVLMSIKKKVGLSILILFVSLAGLVLVYGDRIVISFYGGGLVFNHSTSMDEHKIPTGKTNFCVPEAYFVFSNSFHPGSSIGLNLSMELDSLEPWNIYGKRIGFFANKKNMTRQEINEVLSKEVGLNISDGRGEGKSIDKKWKFLLKDIQRKEEGEFTRLLPGKAAITYYDYHLIPRDAKDYSYIIGCVSGAKCRLENFYGDTIDYEVMFDEKYIGIVDDIDFRARGLIEKFICK